MFPKWEFDVEDTPAENIIKLIFVKKPWKWTMDCWEVTGTWVNTKPAVVSPAKKKVVKEDSPRPRKKARKEASEEAGEEAAAEASEEVHTTVGGLTKEDIKTMSKDIVDAMRKRFGTCLKEIEYLPERVEAVEKKNMCALLIVYEMDLWTKSLSESVNGTNAGRKSLPEDKGPDVPADASSSKDKAPEPSLEDARYLEKKDDALALCRAKSYTPFAPIDKKKLKELADWLKTCPHYRTPLDKKPRTSRTWWFQILRTSLEWLEDCVLGTDIDDVYAPVNYNDTHWIAMWISIPKRHIVVWDSICSSISLEVLDVVMEPFLYMVPYLLVECASSDEQRAQYSLESFTYERPTNIPPARAGDCGVYSLKYIECRALGIEFSKKDFAKPNGKNMRDKMAVDIFQELPDAYDFENKDNDANLGAYEG
uniref:Ubiquitin-like protease family profile domain-containing protein n=1 Tax=Brassica oleracea TaxID=3712 RepID=A0A3P6BQU8_BRAOL|nr:unnamed protein product [Brassica oleracea]